MPRQAASKKPTLQEAGQEASAAKVTEPRSEPAPVPTPTTRYIPRGPNGEPMMPRFMPAECADIMPKLLMPHSWVVAIDASPDRSMTLGSRQWWEQHGQWLEANKKVLKPKPKDWSKREEALSKPEDLGEDRGSHEWDFVCVDAPSADDDYDEEEDDGGEEDEGEDDEEEGDDQRDDEEKEAGRDKASNHAAGDEDKRGPVGKLASLHPSHLWCFSMKGSARGQWWILEALKRDPDEFDMHIYNDFAACGAMEVMENMLCLFADVCEPGADSRDIWCEVEGLALLLQSGVADFSNCDDTETPGQLVELIGHMSVVALRAIKKQGGLNTTGPIPNFGLVLSVLIQCGWELGESIGACESATWVYTVIEMAEEAGIKVTGMPGYETTLEELEADKDDNYTPANKKKWEKINFQTRLKSYKANYGRRMGPRLPAGIGGSHFDITKMTAAERKGYSYRG